MIKNIAVLASGSGSNAENIACYFEANEQVKVKLIISNKENAYVLERAQRLGINSVVLPKSAWSSGEDVLAILQENEIDFIVLAGFLLRIPDLILHTYPNKIINIHPSLLPKYGGKGMYGDKVHEAVVANKETTSGITIHYIDGKYDEGQIIKQVSCAVLPTDTPEVVAGKVHALEYKYYPQVIEEILEKRD
ncbi:phosphoribosylglycinamide formyltransferase [Bacteroides sp. 224]|uniref:phosphoribosylglycinamide formyltransferase n=1 Tax=Bacteroides sp. 224 TaxID=2302936 RepID=UPI0013D5F579|nr:phosphoribosylglycinamide formyltransferase [Bacteroides sp. 224]NDV65495.1 phosphoribosylglycinamide formyltransferase [Bacteroides sp. 224]